MLFQLIINGKQFVRFPGISVTVPGTATNSLQTTDPFEPLLTDKIQARGVFDCKGLFVAHLEAIKVMRSNFWNQTTAWNSKLNDRFARVDK